MRPATLLSPFDLLGRAAARAHVRTGTAGTADYLVRDGRPHRGRSPVSVSHP